MKLKVTKINIDILLKKVDKEKKASSPLMRVTVMCLAIPGSLACIPNS